MDNPYLDALVESLTPDARNYLLRRLTGGVPEDGPRSGELAAAVADSLYLSPGRGHVADLGDGSGSRRYGLIQLIKAVRAIRGLDLRAAKELVDQWRDKGLLKLEE